MPLALFDLDNTLIDRTSAFVESARRFALDHGLDPADVVPFLVDADQDGHAGWEVWLTAAKERYGLADTVDALRAAHQDRYDACFTPDARVHEALGRLRDAGWKVAVVTNGPPRQATKVTICGLDDYVDACCVSEVEGVRKPDPRIFEAAAERCGTTVAGAWMIGDSPEADIAGAHAIGARSIWIARGRAWPADAPCPPPTHTVADIPAAVDILLASS
jgi:putative hydrolase of the HAD superfamily